MIKGLCFCLRGGPVLLEEAQKGSRSPSEQEKLTPGFALPNRSPEQLLDVLLSSSGAADGQDWIYRCVLQLDAAAALLCTSIRLYMIKGGGRFELILGSSPGQAAVLLGPTIGPGKAPYSVSRSESMAFLSPGQDIDPCVFGFETGGPGMVRYLAGNMAAAVPLFCGAGCFGALLLVSEGAAGFPMESYCDTGQPIASSEARFETRPTDFTNCDPLLRQLGIALSLALTPDLPALRRITVSVSRLAGCSSLRELVAELCDTICCHVRQRFLLEPAVRAALVAEADATTAFMLDVSSVPLMSCHQDRHALSAQQQLPQRQQPLQQSMQFPQQQQQQHHHHHHHQGASTSCAQHPSSPASTQGEGATRLSNMTGPCSGKSPLAQVLLTAAEGLSLDGGSVVAPQPLLLSPGCVAPACEAAGGSLVARPFQLSYSLLLRLQLQQPRICGIAVRDCVKLVQDVNQPSRDVCLLMGTSSSTAIAAPMTPIAASLLGESVHKAASSYSYKDGDAGPVIGASQSYTMLKRGGAGGVGISSSAGSAVQSLVLVGCDAGDGVTLAFYVCFPHRLPGPLVEAVRDSCQRLLEKVLLRVISPKATGDLATELGTLRRGTPGTFAIVQMPYSRMGNHLGPGGGAGGAVPSSLAVTGPAPSNGPGTVMSSSTLGSDQPFGGNFGTTSGTTVTTTATTISIIPPLPAAAAAAAIAGGGGNTVSRAVSGTSPNRAPASLGRTIREVSAVASRGVLAHLEASGGCGAGGSTNTPESGKVIGCSSLSNLLLNSSPISAARSRSVTVVRPHYSSFTGHAAVGPGNRAAGYRRKTLGGLSGRSTANRMSDMVVLPSRVPIMDASFGVGGGGGTASWLQMAAGITLGQDAIPALLSSNHVVSGSQVAVSTHPADVLRHAVSVIVVRDLEAEARGGCQQQLGALISSVRETISIAASPAPAAGTCLTAADTGSVRSQTGSLGDAADGVGSNAGLGLSRPIMHGTFVGWEDQPGGITRAATAPAATGSELGLGAAGVRGGVGPTITTTTATAACGLDSDAADVADLRLVCKLGQGGCGSVFLGQMAAGLEVAVKLLELPSCFDIAHFVEQFSPGPVWALRSRGAWGLNSAAVCSSGNEETDMGAVLTAEAVRQQVRARRSLLQSATELAMLTSISHPNIVQVYGAYSNVVLETRTMPDGHLAYRLRQHMELLHEDEMIEAADAAGTSTPYDRRHIAYSNACSAVCMTLCDLGSLASALTDRGFPKMMETTVGPAPTHGSAQVPANHATTAAGQPVRAADPNSTAFGATVLKHMRSVCLTLLEVALALRYLHGRNILHRDLKPGNILLKSRTPTLGDPRGFTTKLADFGLALVLDKAAEPISLPLNQAAQVAQLQQQHLQPGGRPGPGPGWGSGQREAFNAPGRYAVQDQACGTVDHMAPEACRGKGSCLTAATDVYSFGIVMLEVVTAGRRPYGNVPMERIGRLVLAGTRPLFPAWAPPQYRSLAEACWAQDPSARPTAAQLVGAIRQLLHKYAVLDRSSGSGGGGGSGGRSKGEAAAPSAILKHDTINRTAICNTTTVNNTDTYPHAANVRSIQEQLHRHEHCPEGREAVAVTIASFDELSLKIRTPAAADGQQEQAQQRASSTSRG